MNRIPPYDRYELTALVDYVEDQCRFYYHQLQQARKGQNGGVSKVTWRIALLQWLEARAQGQNRTPYWWR